MQGSPKVWESLGLRHFYRALFKMHNLICGAAKTELDS